MVHLTFFVDAMNEISRFEEIKNIQATVAQKLFSNPGCECDTLDVVDSLNEV